MQRGHHHALQQTRVMGAPRGARVPSFRGTPQGGVVDQFDPLSRAQTAPASSLEP